jgi:hypothetical protein
MLCLELCLENIIQGRILFYVSVFTSVSAASNVVWCFKNILNVVWWKWKIFIWFFSVGENLIVLCGETSYTLTALSSRLWCLSTTFSISAQSGQWKICSFVCVVLRFVLIFQQNEQRKNLEKLHFSYEKNLLRVFFSNQFFIIKEKSFHKFQQFMNIQPTKNQLQNFTFNSSLFDFDCSKEMTQ